MAIELHHLNTHDLFRDATKMIDGVTKLKERIAELEKENESLKYSVASLETDLAMSRRWRKCSEELPEEGVEVLVTNGIDCGISDWCGDYWNNDPFCGYTVCDNVIAWMPLPSAPKEEK